MSETKKRDGRGLSGFFRSIFPYFKPYRGWLVLILGAMVVDLAFETFLPLSFKFLIDQAIVPKDAHRLFLILAALAGGAVLTTISLLGMDIASARADTGVMSDLRNSMFNHLQKLSMGFFSRWQAGDIMARFGTDLASVETAITTAMAAAVSSLIGLLISVTLLFSIEWRLAVGAIAGLGLAFFGAKLLEPRASRANDVSKREDGKAQAQLQENLGAQSVIKGYGLQDWVIRLFAGQMRIVRASRVRAHVLNYVMQRIPQAGVLVVSFVILGLGAVFAFRGRMTVGALVAFNGLLMQVTNYVASLTWATPLLMEAAAGMRRIEDILREKPQVEDRPGAGELPPLGREIEFRNVTFSYAGDRPSLCDIDLRIAKGESVAFVGQSGSGKSTALNLIMRFYDPETGCVLMDGTDVRAVTQDSLRRRIGAVFQESFLFNTTIRENIRMGKAGATDEEIALAAARSGVKDFSDRLPDGLETVVGERGGKLSGGQRQRVGIARAMLRDPEILVLDEATSALDPVTEAAVSATLEQLSAGRTVVAVTHRLAPAAHADRIFVFDRGCLAEQGRHDELLARQGVYAGLWQKQSGFGISADGESATVAPARLRQFPILDKIDGPLLEDLAGSFVTEHCPAGREVMREGDPGNLFYIIVRGQAEVTKQVRNGETRRLAVLEVGDHFGEIALLGNVPRTATVRTLTPCIFLTLSRGQFLGILDKAPEVRESVLDLMAVRLRRSTVID